MSFLSTNKVIVSLLKILVPASRARSTGRLAFLSVLVPAAHYSISQNISSTLSELHAMQMQAMVCGKILPWFCKSLYQIYQQQQQRKQPLAE